MHSYHPSDKKLTPGIRRTEEAEHQIIPFQIELQIGVYIEQAHKEATRAWEMTLSHKPFGKYNSEPRYPTMAIMDTITETKK